MFTGTKISICIQHCIVFDLFVKENCIIALPVINMQYTCIFFNVTNKLIKIKLFTVSFAYLSSLQYALHCPAH